MNEIRSPGHGSEAWRLTGLRVAEEPGSVGLKTPSQPPGREQALGGEVVSDDFGLQEHSWIVT